MNDVLFSSESEEWETPQDLYNKLNDIFSFTIDVCATKDNAKCVNYYTKEHNGLEQVWGGVCWMNPPYGRNILAWIRKAYESSMENHTTVVCLLPARTDTRWFHEYCVHGEISFIKGRLKFGNASNSAPFPSMIVVFRPRVSDVL